MDPVAGLEVAGVVRLVRMLGEGGMGSVWEADHLALHTKVAVKFISAHLVTNEKVLERFAQEARSAANIKSPHVVNILDYGATDDGIPYIIMEMLEGEALADRLERGPMGLEQATTLMQQSAMALSKAHAAGIVHRDLKPDNIFLEESDYDIFIKILDFGIAKNTQGGPGVKTQTTTVVGTPHYMSPEQLVSTKNVDHRADLWALSVLLYEVLTCKMPFDGETVTALSIAICSSPHIPFSTSHGSRHDGLDAFFDQAFTKGLDARFKNVRDMAQTFREQVMIKESALGSTLAIDSAEEPWMFDEASHAEMRHFGPDASGSHSSLGGMAAGAPDASGAYAPIGVGSADQSGAHVSRGTLESGTGLAGTGLAGTGLAGGNTVGALTTDSVPGAPKKKNGALVLLLGAAALLLIVGIGYAFVDGDSGTETNTSANSAEPAMSSAVPSASPEASNTFPDPSADPTTEPSAAPSTEGVTPSATVLVKPTPPRPRPNPRPQPPNPRPVPKPKCKTTLVPQADGTMKAVRVCN